MKKFYTKMLLSVAMSAMSITGFADQPATLTFTTFCSNEAVQGNSSTATEEWNSFTQALSRQIHSPVKLLCASSRSDVVKKMLAGDAQFGYVKQLEYQLLESDTRFQPFASALEPNGKTAYHGVFLSNKHDEIPLNDIGSIKIGLFKDSASGLYLPEIILKKNHLYNPKNIVMMSSYEEGLLALKNKEVRLLAFPETFYPSMLKTMQIQDDFAIAYVMNPALPTPVLVANIKLVDANTLNTIKNAVASAVVNKASAHRFASCPMSGCELLSETNESISSKASLEAPTDNNPNKASHS